LINYNAAFQAYNLLLNATVYELREKWPDANIFLFDYFEATYEVIKNPEKYGKNFINKTIRSVIESAIVWNF